MEKWHRRGLSYLVKHEPHAGCDGSPAKGIALQGAKGVGKSTLEAWITWWFETFPYANVAAMSITGDNLRDNLWKEMAVWYSRSPFLKRGYEMRGERIVPRGTSKEDEIRWFVSARSFPAKPDKEQQASVVAGLHSDHVMAVLDESGDVPPGVLAAAEGIHANPVHSLVLVGGNTTSRDGALYDASVKRGHRYHVIKVTGDPDDPEHSLRTDLTYSKGLIDDHGRSDPRVMINVLAEFPMQGITKLLGEGDIAKSLGRKIAQRDHQQEPKIAALDIARHGLDSSVYTLRQGPMLWPQKQWHIEDLMDLADQVAMELERDKPDALIVLATGIGWGVYDRLRKLKWKDILIAVDEGKDALDPKYRNRRTEMWWQARDWVRDYGQLVDDAELKGDLLAPGWYERFFSGRTCIHLDPSEVVKQLLGRSPDKGTSFAGTFAAPVSRRRERPAPPPAQEPDFDPWAAMRTA